MMKNHLRPAFGHYLKAMPNLKTGSAYAQSNGLMYELADRELAFIAQFAIPIALYFLYRFSPFILPRITLFNLWNIIALGIALLAAYWLVFVYWFAAFSTREDDSDWVSSLCPEEEKTKPEEPKALLIKRRIKSAFAFVALLSVLTGLMLLYCLSGRGQSVERFYNTHKEQLNKLAGFTQKYSDFYADVFCIPPYIYDNDSFSKIPEYDKDEIEHILSGLSSSEIYVFATYTVEGMLIFSLTDRWDDRYELQWCPFVVSEPTSNKAYDSLFVVKTDLKKLDDHWRYFSEKYKLYWGMHG